MARLSYAAIALTLAASTMAAPLNPVDNELLARGELTTHHYREDLEPELYERKGLGFLGKALSFVGLRDDDEVMTREDIEQELYARKGLGFLGKALSFVGLREDGEAVTRDDLEPELYERKGLGFLGKALSFVGLREDGEDVTRDDLEEVIEEFAREYMDDMPLESRWWSEENDNFAREDTEDYWDLALRDLEELD